ncbi:MULTISPECIES: FtsW/RodA/SpoVE family cell cycle protein [Moorena]|uniref:Probable peptidoglycan glycosyltransferase FtsW n=1 Tax=Moorena producens 3L TaxID=489825 RepID=F4XLJ4_9CYAN|nr:MULTISPECIES: FtsW/RodA/SpoVE family cell cycle protein [Moorena]NEQ13617.1 FtsW/RodA/SpoVE family cell cycle protein [Moorena sp. SIO3E2]EGJ34469.1 bacterial cell division membrane protein [Moorena producens 3L]NEP34216.1 FtsW/RodA/SpoVE family cell cycle protein [Moorena sp. SIO3B2]NEP70008.1 FtsW/RodA/SpoVE family cell cycle protein [Moorena sp. SIO3A5]NER86838.1 FtsW/RodA/SpoVE family cell cycle protein [Moorena sp. SIO3A2]
MALRNLILLFNPSTTDWAVSARLLKWLTFLWLLIGIVILFSASYAIADVELGDGTYYVKRQLMWVVLGLVGFNLLVRSPLRYLLKISHWLVLGLLVLLLLTLIPGVGTTVNGATRWLSFGSVPLQPSELMKPFLVLQAARVFGQWDRLQWRTRFTWLGIFMVVLVGILLQPNLSTTALCGMTLWLVALAAGLPFSYLGGTAFGGVLLAVLSISIKDYQRRRVMSFLNPWADPMRDGYQLVQSLLAIGSGGTWGSGFGLSQQKLFYLPIQHTDFIFSVFAEEFGFAGSIALMLLLMTYMTLAVIVAIKARNRVYQLIAIGAMLFIVGQSLLNIGVASGALPTTGLPFPFFSYGGSSMISSLCSAGLLIRVARESSEAKVVSIQSRRQSIAERRQRRHKVKAKR